MGAQALEMINDQLYLLVYAVGPEDRGCIRMPHVPMHAAVGQHKGTKGQYARCSPSRVSGAQQELIIGMKNRMQLCV